MSSTSKPYFDDLGGQWDALRKSFFSERVRQRAVEAAGVKEGDETADLGAGTGFVTEALLEQGARVIAVDQSAAMLEALRAKFPEPRPVRCQVGEAGALPVAAASVQSCFANMYLHHVEEPAAAISEMWRILKPGGMAVVTDLDSHESEFLRAEHHDRWMGFPREELRRWFQKAGFVNVQVEGLGEQCCTTSEDGTESAKISIFMATGRRPGESV